MTQIAEGLAADLDIKIICGQPNYAARGHRAPKHELHNGVEIFRVWSTLFDKNVLPLRLINMLTLGASMLFRALRKLEKDVGVVVVSAPPSLLFIAALAAKIRRAPLYLIIQDKYPEILVAVGSVKNNSFLVKLLNGFNRWLYRRAEKIVVVGRDMGELVASQMDDQDAGKISVIQNWASLEEIEPRPRSQNRLLNDLQIGHKLVFLYAGNMGHPQDIESIVKCAELLKDDERFHFIFIGSGVKRKWLENAIRSRRLDNTTLLDPLPRAEQEVFLNACDVGLVPLVENMFGVAMPSRTYNLLAAGKPVLALTDENSEVSRVLREERVGWNVPPLAPEKLLAAIETIYENRERLPEMGRLARLAAEKKYSVAVAVAKYRQLILNDGK